MHKFSSAYDYLVCDNCKDIMGDEDAIYYGWSTSRNDVDNTKGNVSPDYVHLCQDCQETHCPECAEKTEKQICRNNMCIDADECRQCGEYVDEGQFCKSKECEEKRNPYLAVDFNSHTAYTVRFIHCDGIDCCAEYTPEFDRVPDGWHHEDDYESGYDLCSECYKEHCPNCGVEREQYTRCKHCLENPYCRGCGHYKDNFGNCNKNNCAKSKKCVCCSGERTGNPRRCTDSECPTYENPYMEFFAMKESSVVICPICGGPTHLNRDTGDFTCDHCGKIVVRSSKNSWVNDFLSIEPNIINEEMIREATSKEVKVFIKKNKKAGWIHEERKNHNVFIWPHAPKGENAVTFAATPSDSRWQKNTEARMKKIVDAYPAPKEEKQAPKQIDLDSIKVPQTPSFYSPGTPAPTTQEKPAEATTPITDESVDARMKAIMDRVLGGPDIFYSTCGGSSGARRHNLDKNKVCDYCKVGTWAERQIALGRHGSPGRMNSKTSEAFHNIQDEDPEEPRNKKAYDKVMGMYNELQISPSEGTTAKSMKWWEN